LPFDLMRKATLRIIGRLCTAIYIVDHGRIVKRRLWSKIYASMPDRAFARPVPSRDRAPSAIARRTARGTASGRRISLLERQIVAGDRRVRALLAQEEKRSLGRSKSPIFLNWKHLISSPSFLSLRYFKVYRPFGILKHCSEGEPE
jgi:hypothetical protein